MQVERRLTRRELAALGSFAAQRPIDPSESEAERLKTVANVSAKTQTTTIETYLYAAKFYKHISERQIEHGFTTKTDFHSFLLR